MIACNRAYHAPCELQRKHQTIGQTFSYLFVVHSRISCRLELHRVPLRVCNRHKSRQTALANPLESVFRESLRACLLPFHVRDIRAYTICRFARHPRSRLLQRSARKESDCKQSYEMGVLHILSVAPSRDCVDTHFCVIYRL